MEFLYEKKLIQQTPIIHFQSGQAGACLRATEVKPKLDAFLIKRLARKGMPIPEGWKLKDSKKKKENLSPLGDGDYGQGEEEEARTALDYKMSFAPCGPAKQVPTPAIYYGNMGDGPKVKGLMGDNILRIVCLIPELMQVIQDNIEDFFIVTNFGRMADKGFGSYVVEGMRKTAGQIGQILGEDCEAEACYCFGKYGVSDAIPVEQYVMITKNGRKEIKVDKKGKQVTEVKCPVFDDIRSLYSVMKAGFNQTRDEEDPDRYHRSFLYEYFHEKEMYVSAKDKEAGVIPAPKQSLGNEKKYTKVKGIVPIVEKAFHRGKVHENEETEYRYVKAVLGTGIGYKYVASIDGQDRPASFGTLKIEGVDIERYPSPIMFKYIRGMMVTKDKATGEKGYEDKGMVFVVARRLDPTIFGKEFVFSSTTSREKVTLKAPDSFDVDNFLAYFASRYNSEVKQGNPLWRMSDETVTKLGKPVKERRTIKRAYAMVKGVGKA